MSLGVLLKGKILGIAHLTSTSAHTQIKQAKLGSQVSSSLIIFIIVISPSRRVQCIQPLYQLSLPFLICQFLQVVPATEVNIQSNFQSNYHHTSSSSRVSQLDGCKSIRTLGFNLKTGLSLFLWNILIHCWGFFLPFFLIHQNFISYKLFGLNLEIFLHFF